MTITSLSEPLKVGQLVFDRYQLIRLVGIGGMGHVWLAQDLELGTPRALKFITGVFEEAHVELAKLRREALRSQELTHENIVRIYDLVRDDELAAISMEYIDGFTLKELRKHQPESCFELTQIRDWMTQLCRALSFAHGQGIVHLDLKPSNLMINSRGQLKVTDFGISRSLGDGDPEGLDRHPSGTPAFMSPQRLNQMPASIADDIYSLGATLHALLTGRPPFGKSRNTGNTPAPSIREARETLKVTGKTDVPERWEATVLACLSADPKARPSTILEVAQQLGLPTGGMSHDSPAVLSDEVTRVRSLLQDHAPAVADEEATEVILPTRPSWQKWLARAAVLTAAATMVFSEAFQEARRHYRYGDSSKGQSKASEIDTASAEPPRTQ